MAKAESLNSVSPRLRWKEGMEKEGIRVQEGEECEKNNGEEDNLRERERRRGREAHIWMK